MAPEEWDTFIEFLRKQLPAAFRINSRYVYMMYSSFAFLLGDLGLIEGVYLLYCCIYNTSI